LNVCAMESVDGGREPGREWACRSLHIGQGLPVGEHRRSVSAIDLLDGFYAAAMGCPAEYLRAGKVVVVQNDLRSVWFAKGCPVGLYALDSGEGTVISARSALAQAAREALAGAMVFADLQRRAIERSVTPLANVQSWFEGVRLFCEPVSFSDRTMDGTREIFPHEDEPTSLLRRRWGGGVFGHVVGDTIVCRVAIKPLSEVVWDLHVETLPHHRGRGYAASAVSAASKHVFDRGRLVGWGCDSTNVASLRVAKAVGFTMYGSDFGCVENVEGSTFGEPRAPQT